MPVHNKYAWTQLCPNISVHVVVTSVWHHKEVRQQEVVDDSYMELVLESDGGWCHCGLWSIVTGTHLFSVNRLLEKYIKIYVKFQTQASPFHKESSVAARVPQKYCSSSKK